MNIRVPKSITEDLEFCNEMFEISYPEMGQRALRWFHNPSTNLELEEIKPKEKEKLSKEGFNFGDKPFCYTTNDFRNIVVEYVKKSIESHKANFTPLKLDSYGLETDSEQLLISVAEANLKEKVIKLIKELYICFDGDYIKEGSEIDNLITKIEEL